MKMSIEPVLLDFTPIDVTFTLESQAELDALGTLFNTMGIINALGEISGDRHLWAKVWSRFIERGANVHQTSIVLDACKRVTTI